MKIQLSKNGVYQSIQGEGRLLGVPMVFVRLAGCSIGCKQCDTNYAAFEAVTLEQLVERVKAVRGSAEWIWITGGEPANNPSLFLIASELRRCGRVGLATSGQVGLGGAGQVIQFLSVSPHCKPNEMQIRAGSQINLVPGLGGLSLDDWDRFDARGFDARYVTPTSVGGVVDQQSLSDCREFVLRHSDWRLGVQAHNAWGLE